MAGGVGPSPAAAAATLRSSSSPDHHLWMSSLIWPDIPLQASISCVAVNPRGSFLATGTHSGHIYVWYLSALHRALARPDTRLCPLPKEALSLASSSESHWVSRNSLGAGQGPSSSPIAKAAGADDAIPAEEGSDSAPGDAGAAEADSGLPPCGALPRGGVSRSDPGFPPAWCPPPLSFPAATSSSAASGGAGPNSFEAPVPLVPHLILISEWGGAAALIECVFAVASAPLLQACSEEVLVSLHADSKLRVWSLLDGRCLSVTKQFPYPLLSVRVLSDRRYVVLTGQTGAFVFDLWTRCRVCHLSLSLPLSAAPSTAFHRRHDEASLHPSPVSSPAQGPFGDTGRARSDEGTGPLPRWRKPERDPRGTHAGDAWPLLRLFATATNAPPDCSEEGLRRLKALFPNLAPHSRAPLSSLLAETGERARSTPRDGRDLQQRLAADSPAKRFPASEGHAHTRPPSLLNSPSASASSSSFSASSPFAFLTQQSQQIAAGEVARGDSFGFLSSPQPSRGVDDDISSLPLFPRLDTAPRGALATPPSRPSSHLPPPPLYESPSFSFSDVPVAHDGAQLPPFLEQPVAVGGLTPEGRLAVWDLRGVLASWEQQQLDGLGGQALFQGKRERAVFGALLAEGSGATADGRSPADSHAAGTEQAGGLRVASAFAGGVGGRLGGAGDAGGAVGLLAHLGSSSSSAGKRGEEEALRGPKGKRRGGGKAAGAGGRTATEGAAAVLQPMRTMFEGMFGDAAEDESDDDDDEDPEIHKRLKGVEPVFVSHACCAPVALPEVGGTGASTLLCITASYLIAISCERLVVWRRVWRGGDARPSAPPSVLYDPFLDIPAAAPASPAARSCLSSDGDKGDDEETGGDRRAGTWGEAGGLGDAFAHLPSAQRPRALSGLSGEDETHLLRAPSSLADVRLATTGEPPRVVPGWCGAHLLAYSSSMERFCRDLDALHAQQLLRSLCSKPSGERGRDAVRLGETEGARLHAEDPRGPQSHTPLDLSACVPRRFDRVEAVLIAWLTDGVVKAFPLPLLEAAPRGELAALTPGAPCDGSHEERSERLWKADARAGAVAWTASDLALAREGLLVGRLSDDLLGGEDTPSPVFLPLASCSPSVSLFSSFPSARESAAAGAPKTQATLGWRAEERAEGEEEESHAGRQGEGRERELAVRISRRTSAGLLSIGVSLEASDRVSVASWTLEETGRPSACWLGVQGSFHGSSAERSQTSNSLIPDAHLAEAFLPPGSVFAHDNETAETQDLSAVASRSPSSVAASSTRLQRPSVSRQAFPPACAGSRSPVAWIGASRRLRASVWASLSLSDLWRLPSTLRASLHRTLFPPIPLVLSSPDASRKSSLCFLSGGAPFADGPRVEKAENGASGMALRSQFWRLLSLLERNDGHAACEDAYLPLKQTAAMLASMRRAREAPLPSGKAEARLARPSPRGADAKRHTADRHILSWCLVESQGRVFLICSSSDGAALGLCLNHVAGRLRLRRHHSHSKPLGRSPQADGEVAGAHASCRRQRRSEDRMECGLGGEACEEGEEEEDEEEEALYLSGQPETLPWPAARHDLPSLVHLPTPATHPALVAEVEAQGRRRRASAQRGCAARRCPRGGGGARGGAAGGGGSEIGASRGSVSRPHREYSGWLAAGGGGLSTTCPPTSEELEETLSEFASSADSASMSSQRVSSSSSEEFSPASDDDWEAWSVASSPSSPSCSSPPSDDEARDRRLSTSSLSRVPSGLVSSSSRSVASRRVHRAPSAAALPSSAPLYACAHDQVKTQITHFCSLSSVLLAGGTSRGDILFWRLPSFSVCGFLPHALPAPVSAMLRVLAVCGGQGETQFDSNCFLAADASGQLTLIDAAKCCGCTDTSSANPPDARQLPAEAAHGAASDRNRAGEVEVPASRVSSRASDERAIHTTLGGKEQASAAAHLASAGVAGGGGSGGAAGEGGRREEGESGSLSRREGSRPGQAAHDQRRQEDRQVSRTLLTPAAATKGLVESPLYVHYRASTWSVRTPALLQAVPRPCNWSGVFPLERLEGAPLCFFSGFRAPGEPGVACPGGESGLAHASSPVAPHAIRKVAVDLLSDTICCITASAQFFLWKIQTGRLLKYGPLSRIPGVFAPDAPNPDSGCARTFLQNPHLHSSSPHLEMTVWGFALGHLQLASSSCCRCCHFSTSVPPALAASSRPQCRTQRRAARRPREGDGAESRGGDPAHSVLSWPEGSTSAPRAPATASQPSLAVSTSASRADPVKTRDRGPSQGRRSRGLQAPLDASRLCQLKSSVDAHRTLPSAAVLLLPLAQFLQACQPPRPLVASSSALADGSGGGRPAGGAGGAAGAAGSRGEGAEQQRPPLAAHALALCSAFLPFGVDAAVDFGLQELFSFLAPSPLPLVPGVIGADLAISFSLPLLLIHGLLHDFYLRQAARAAELRKSVSLPPQAALSLPFDETPPSCHQPSLRHSIRLHAQAARRADNPPPAACSHVPERQSSTSLASAPLSPSSPSASSIGVASACEVFAFFAAALAERDAAWGLRGAAEEARRPAFADAVSPFVALHRQLERRKHLRKAGCSSLTSPSSLALQQRLARTHRLPGLCRASAGLKALVATGPSAAVVSPAFAPASALPVTADAGLLLGRQVPPLQGEASARLSSRASVDAGARESSAESARRGERGESLRPASLEGVAPSPAHVALRLGLPPPPLCEALSLSGLPALASGSAATLRASSASPFFFSSSSSLSLACAFLGSASTGGRGGGRGGGLLSRVSLVSRRQGAYVFGMFLASAPSAFLSACSRSPDDAARAYAGAKARLHAALDETLGGGALTLSSRQQQMHIQYQQQVLYRQLDFLQTQQKAFEAKAVRREDTPADEASQAASQAMVPGAQAREDRATAGPTREGNDAAVGAAQRSAGDESVDKPEKPTLLAAFVAQQVRQLQAQQEATRQQLVRLQQQLVALADGEHWGEDGKADGGRRLIRGRERLLHLSLVVATAPWPSPREALRPSRTAAQEEEAASGRGGRPGAEGGEEAASLPSPQIQGGGCGHEAPKSEQAAPSVPSTSSSLSSTFSSLSSPPRLLSPLASLPAGAAAPSDPQFFRCLLALRREERGLWLRPGSVAARSLFSIPSAGGGRGRIGELHAQQRPAASLGGLGAPGGGRVASLAMGAWPSPRFSTYKDTVLTSPPCADLLRLSSASLASPHLSATTSLSFLCLLSAAFLPSLTPPPPSAGTRAALVQAFADTFSLAFFPARAPTPTPGSPCDDQLLCGPSPACRWRGGGGDATDAISALDLAYSDARHVSRLSEDEHDAHARGAAAPLSLSRDVSDALQTRAHRRSGATEEGAEGAPLEDVAGDRRQFGPWELLVAPPAAPVASFPSLWLLTQCFLQNCPASAALHASHRSAGPAAAVYVHLGACHLLRRAICAMDEKRILPFVDVALQILGGHCASLQNARRGEDAAQRPLAGGADGIVAALPATLAEELDCAATAEAALVLLALIIYERPGLSRIAGLNIGAIVGHHLAWAFLGALLPLAASGPSASAGGLVCHSAASELAFSTAVQPAAPLPAGASAAAARGGAPARVELLMEIFALGLNILWGGACLFSRKIANLLDAYTPRGFTEKLGGTNSAGVFEALLPDEVLLCQLMAAMFALTLRPQWSACSSLILTRLARANFALFIKVLGRAAKTVDFGSEYTAAALLTLVQFAARIPELSLEHLPDIVEAVVRCLDPAEPHLRRRALNAATAALFHLVRCFPLATFHQQTQRFAVGCSDGLIILYDLRTATKWKVLEGHTGAISCLSFSDDGSLLGSYSIADCSMRLWQSSSSGFFGGILGVSAKSQKIVQLPPCPKNIFWQSIPYQLETVRMVNKSKSEWMIRREDGKGYMVLVS
ncbi:hypothetical protein BESB_007540 [Besnoitia besnoiti]|uniref:Uncharacterized protein n=1 Tax=Besnoitia besnoiti TaxID=94643 RepID=A0A2A9MQR1_BESBE|nr:hypothetical protein BESB_007540 [Besnoitia besnoiti]PFH38412.1 hypothetical protein BESB_007540 [Besnoitia besnoiti]